MIPILSSSNPICDACGSKVLPNSSYCMECGSSTNKNHIPMPALHEKEGLKQKPIKEYTSGELMAGIMTILFTAAMVFMFFSARILALLGKPLFYTTMIAAFMWAVKTIFTTKEKEK